MLYIGRGQIALRIGQHFLGVRGPSMPAYYSERNRLSGWRVWEPFPGWRAFYRRSEVAA